jgi:hypothetical protein
MSMTGLIVLLGLAVVAVPILLVLCLVSLSALKARVGDLERELEWLRATARPRVEVSWSHS